MARRSQRGDPQEVEPTEQGRDRSPARALGVLVVIAIAAVFVIENAQTVKVRWWFVTGHVRLLWIMVVCLVIGAVGEALVRRVVRSRLRARRQRSR